MGKGLMPRMLSGLCAATATLVLLMVGVADASTTLGSTSIPSGGSGNDCNPGAVFDQATSDPATPFTTPGAGTLTQWQVNTIDAAPNTPLTFVVLKAGSGSATVAGVDSRTLPSPLPPGDNVVTFTLPTPIAVTGGETLGLYTDSSTVYCEWSGGSLPPADTLAAHLAPTPPAAGQSLPFYKQSGAGYRMNLAATFEPPAPIIKKKCKKHKKKRSAESAKKKCKKKKKKG